MSERQRISVGDITISPDDLLIIGGPCAIESREQMLETAEHVTANGAQIIRGGAYKPRTRPENFRGLKEEGLDILFEAGRTYNVPVVTEVMRIEQIQTIKETASGHPFIYQIGSRNAQNYDLLEEVGKTGIPVLLKRGMGATLDETLGAARYVTSGGSPVLLCERGVRTFSSGSGGVGRNTPDMLAVIKMQEAGYLTVFDPSHAAGESKYVTPLAVSGVAIGADGLIVEVHNRPELAMCDGPQALTYDQFTEMVNLCHDVRGVLNQRSHIEQPLSLSLSLADLRN